MRVSFRQILVLLIAIQTSAAFADTEAGSALMNALDTKEKAAEPQPAESGFPLIDPSGKGTVPLSFIGVGPAWSTNLPQPQHPQSTAITATGSFGISGTAVNREQQIFGVGALRLNAGLGAQGTKTDSGTRYSPGADFGASAKAIAGKTFTSTACAPGLAAGMSGDARYVGGVSALGGTDLHLSLMPAVACNKDSLVVVAGPTAAAGAKTGELKTYVGLGGLVSVGYKDALLTTVEALHKYGLENENPKAPLLRPNRETQVTLSSYARLVGPYWLGLDASVAQSKSKDLAGGDVAATNITVGASFGGTLGAAISAK